MKKISLVLIIGVSVIGLTGCGGNNVTAPFSISCESFDDNGGATIKNSSIYNFGTNQIVTDYEITTVSSYDDEETYKIYRDAAKEAEKNNDNERITYKVETNDETHTVNFSYKEIINEEALATIKEDDYYNASKVLERAEETGAKCTLSGIERDQLK